MNFTVLIEAKIMKKSRDHAIPHIIVLNVE